MRSISGSIELLLHFAELPSGLASDQWEAGSSNWIRLERLMHFFVKRLPGD